MYPKISILIPTYQMGKYIERCLRSALVQTYPNIEVVIVDDGSNDETPNIIRKYIKNHTNVRYIFVEHCGLSNIRNILIKESSGEYIFFLDADDFLAKEAIYTMYNVLVQYQTDMVQCTCCHTSNDYIDEPDVKRGITIYSKEEALLAYNRTLQGLFCMVIGKLYKKKIFLNIEFPKDGRTHEDEYVAFLVLDKCSKIAVLQQNLYGYYNNTASIMRKQFNLARYDVLEAIQNSIQFFSEKKMWKQVSRINFRYLTLIRCLYESTYKYYPEEKERLEYLMKEYTRVLPEVINKLNLSQELVDEFQKWGEQPLSVESYNYWYYVRHNMLPE